MFTVQWFAISSKCEVLELNGFSKGGDRLCNAVGGGWTDIRSERLPRQAASHFPSDPWHEFGPERTGEYVQGSISRATLPCERWISFRDKYIFFPSSFKMALLTVPCKSFYMNKYFYHA